METLIFHPKTKEQLAAFKAVAKALKVGFEIEKALTTRNLLRKFYKPEKILKMAKALK